MDGMIRLRWILALCLLLALCLPACTYVAGDTRVFVTSEPPGADILVDGSETGQTTPGVLELGGCLGDDHEITVQRKGYEPEKRTVVHHNSYYTSKWIDGADELVIDFPLWWTLGDFFTPFAIKWQYVPHELHVVLYELGQAPVHGEVESGEEPGQKTDS